MSESDEKPFTVSDRRHFTPEGRPREEPEAKGASETPPTEGPPATPGAEARTDASPPPATGGPADFSHFVVGLAAQAGALLTGQGLPEGVDPREALEGARSVIAILEMLQDKTAGNLEGPETALLEDVLFQLRIAYVEKTRSGGA